MKARDYVAERRLRGKPLQQSTWKAPAASDDGTEKREKEVWNSGI